MKSSNYIFIGVVALAVALPSCSVQKRRIVTMQEQNMAADLAVTDKEQAIDFDMTVPPKPKRDTLIVQDDNGNDMLIMKAVADENGEMVAHDVIDAAVVTARFRNVAERHGKVDIEFQVIVPEAMQDSKWQLRFNPRMEVLGDTLDLDPVIITGRDYRKAQLRGYQQYERFLNSIITDETLLQNKWQLEIFIERNLPEIYKFKSDTSYVADDVFHSYFGVTEKEAVDHYTNQFRVNRNNKKIANKDKMFAKYVKAPIISEGIRLDTVMQAVNGDFIYNYVQPINVQPKLRKADVMMSGAIFEQEKRIYNVPQSDPLTFYISSLSALVDNTEKYLTQTIYRQVEANTASYIDFEQGKADVKENLFNNAEEIGRIKQNLRDLLENEKFDLDSIVVTASASPEGTYENNRKLTQRRSESVSAYFNRFLRQTQDSLRREGGFSINVDDTYASKEKPVKIRFISKNDPENWSALDVLVNRDETLTPDDKSSYFELADISDLDAREKALSGKPYYKHLREVLYPRTRTVRFDFFLHRKGMVEEQMETTVLDTTYMRGVQAIRDRDYEVAVTLLRPYMDYNAAVAFSCMDYNQSALTILKDLEKTANVNYLLAVIYSRMSDDQAAVQCYLDACRQDGTFVHRGNLDPEISALIKRYGLNKQEYDDIYD